MRARSELAITRRMSEPYIFQMNDLRKVHPGGKEVLKGTEAAALKYGVTLVAAATIANDGSDAAAAVARIVRLIVGHVKRIVGADV